MDRFTNCRVCGQPLYGDREPLAGICGVCTRPRIPRRRRRRKPRVYVCAQCQTPGLMTRMGGPRKFCPACSTSTARLRRQLGFQPPPVAQPEPEHTGPTHSELRRKCDMVALELLTGDLPAAPDPPAKRAPSDTELKAKAAALGYPVPRPKRASDLDAVRAEARKQMLSLLLGAQDVA